MKKLPWIGVVCLFVGMAAVTLSGQDRAGNQRTRDQFVGAWRLAWLEEQGADGEVHKADCAGLLVYTRDGHMSVQVMYRNPPAVTNAAPVQYAQGGYEASFGTYEIDESTHTFTFHVEGALVRTQWFQAVRRFMETYEYMLIPSAQLFPFDAKLDWPHEIAGKRMEFYYDWMNALVQITMSSMPSLNVPAPPSPKR